uniref:Fe2OG dioxygenase domain-containing protein n=1 Tax=Lotus japonicus TaxID=34305 RepID=I3SHE6_LOTJA|nr:unknown [Lotus japonicus]
MDREMVMKLGTSLAVPSVQELAKQPITKVPEQYVRPNQEPPVISNTTSLPQVPVIDFNKLFSDDGAELEKLDHACKEWGFFQLINHGVNHSLVEKMKMDVQKFFNLPKDEKKVFAQKPGEMEGLGQMFIASEETKLEWADLFLIVTLPENIRNPHLFPNLPQPFRDHLERYALELKNLYVSILELMAKALKFQPSELPELFEEGGQAMRMNYYPPCPQPEKVMGLNPHSDNSILTLLLQVNEIVGLEVRKGGRWVPIKPLPNAFIINVGDALEIMTNGIYRSIEHRATANSVKERISIATFQSPRLNAFIGPASSLVTSERPAMFNKISVEEFYKGYFSDMLQGKSHINALRNKNE